MTSPKTPNTVSSRRNEVWGKPVSHSQSPRLHLAAYEALGVDWDYRRVEVGEDELADCFRTLGDEVGGLSLTMPLKEDILGLVSDHRGPVDILHAANTVVRGDGGWWLDNTDWWGVSSTLLEHGGVAEKRVWLLGAGATARSVIYALSTLNVGECTIVVRDRSRALATAVLCETLSIPHNIATFDQVGTLREPDWVISTVPGGAVDNPNAFAEVAKTSRYMDAAYHPWPTPLAEQWLADGQQALSGLWMLSYQALAQVRCFVTGSSDIALPHEGQVLDAMRLAVGLPGGTAPIANVGE